MPPLCFVATGGLLLAAPLAHVLAGEALLHLGDVAAAAGQFGADAAEVLVGHPHREGDERLQHHRASTLDGFLHRVAGSGDEGDFVGVDLSLIHI